MRTPKQIFKDLIAAWPKDDVLDNQSLAITYHAEVLRDIAEYMGFGNAISDVGRGVMEMASEHIATAIREGASEIASSLENMS